MDISIDIINKWINFEIIYALLNKALPEQFQIQRAGDILTCDNGNYYILSLHLIR